MDKQVKITIILYIDIYIQQLVYIYINITRKYNFVIIDIGYIYSLVFYSHGQILVSFTIYRVIIRDFL